MKKIILLILTFIQGAVLAQDLQIPENPYQSANEEISRRKSFNREKHFYEQRMYPFNRIPDDAYEKALDERNKMRQREGMYLDGPFDTWTNIGPTTGFYFSYSNITSRMVTVKYDPSNGNTIYVGAAFGGIWKSTDGGATWKAKSDFETSLSSGSLTIDPSNPDILYYGTGEATYSGASYLGRGLLKSTNGGDTWTSYTSGLPTNSYTSRIAIRPNNSDHLLAAMGNNGLYRSINGGVSWTQIVAGRCDDVVFTPTGDTAYIVGSGTGYRISTNGGSSFTASAALTLNARNHIAICKTSPNILYASIYNSSTGAITVFKSVNAGSTFTQIASGQNFSGSQAWYDFYMHVNPFDANYAYVGSIDVWRTTNGGSSNFTNITNAYSGGNVHPDQHNMDFHPTDPNQLVCVNDGGIWKSTNRGTSWVNMNTNLTLTQFYRIASDPSNMNHVMGGTQDNGTQRTTGAINWAAAFGGDGGEVCFHEKNNNYILGETQNNGIYRSTNGGLSWASSTSGLSGSGSWVGPILSHPDSNGIFYTARAQVFKSTNWGASWFGVSTGTSGTIREMAISKSSAAMMYATSGSTIYRSTNRGYTYTNVTTGLPARTITSVSIHPDSSQVAVITFSGFGAGKIYKTTNGGSSWNNISGNLPDAPCNDAVIYYPGMSTSILYIATDIGVFVTNNFGQSWVEVASGLPNTVAMHLDYHSASGRLRLGTHGRGTWEIQLRTTPSDAQAYSLGETGNRYYPVSTISPKGQIRNNSFNTSNISVTRKIEPGGYISTKNAAAVSGEIVNVTFDPWTFTPDVTYTVTDSVYIADDINTSNDKLSGSLKPMIGSINNSFCGGFSEPSFPGAWTLEYTGDQYWTRSTASSYGNGTGSAKFDSYNADGGTRQSLISPLLAPSNTGDSLRFDFAYSPYSVMNSTDSLIIETSTGSGFSRLAVMWGNSTGGSLNTSAASAAQFIPVSTDWATKKYLLPPGTTMVKFTAHGGYGNNLYLDSICVEDIDIPSTFSIKLMPQAFYNSVTNSLNMSDTCTAYLRSTVSPFAIVSTSVAVVDSITYIGNFSFANAESGTYYLQINHRNTIETWSKPGGESFTEGGHMNYDFTVSPSQAYGNNQVAAGPNYSFYSGDVEQNGLVGLSDLVLTNNDATLFLNGYVVTDVTGNKVVNLEDLIYVYNNSSLFVAKSTP